MAWIKYLGTVLFNDEVPGQLRIEVDKKRASIGRPEMRLCRPGLIAEKAIGATL